MHLFIRSKFNERANNSVENVCLLVLFALLSFSKHRLNWNEHFLEGLLDFIENFCFVLVTTQTAKDREVEKTEQKAERLPRGCVPTGSLDSEISEFEEGEEECENRED